MTDRATRRNACKKTKSVWGPEWYHPTYKGQPIYHGNPKAEIALAKSKLPTALRLFRAKE